MQRAINKEKMLANAQNTSFTFLLTSDQVPLNQINAS